MKGKVRVFLTAAMLLCMLLFIAVPAHAVADLGVGTADGPVPWLLTAECTIAAGATTNGSTITYAFKATAEAEGPAFATQVACTVYDEAGNPTGGCNGALFGAAAACAGTATMSIGDIPRLCVTASALYATGTASLPPCP